MEKAMPVTIGVLRETTAGETRVALVPEVITKFTDLGAQLLIETGAGQGARIPDELFNGAEFSPNPQGILSSCDKRGIFNTKLHRLESQILRAILLKINQVAMSHH